MPNIKPIDISRVKKILIIHLQTFGDTIIATSILEALSKHMPQAEISWLVYKPYQTVLYKHPYIKDIISVPKGVGWRYLLNRITTFSKISVMHFDMVIDLQNNPNTQIITLLSLAKYRIGYSDGQYAFVYNYKVTRGPYRFMGCQKFDFLTPFGIPEQPYKYYYHIFKESVQYIEEWLNNTGLDKQEFVVFSPGSPVARKKWRMEHYVTLGDLVWENLRLPVVLLWAKNEYQDCCVISEHMKKKPIMAPETDMNQAMALLNKA